MEKALSLKIRKEPSWTKSLLGEDVFKGKDYKQQVFRMLVTETFRNNLSIVLLLISLGTFFTITSISFVTPWWIGLAFAGIFIVIALVYFSTAGARQIINVGRLIPGFKNFDEGFLNSSDIFDSIVTKLDKITRLNILIEIFLPNSV